MGKRSIRIAFALLLAVIAKTFFWGSHSEAQADASACEPFLAQLDRARSELKLQERFPLPKLELNEKRDTFVADNVPGIRLAIKCDSAGSVLSLSYAGSSAQDDDFNRFAGFSVSTAAALEPGDPVRSFSNVFFDWFSAADTRMRANAVKGEPGVSERAFGRYRARLTLSSDRRYRVDMAQHGAYLAYWPIPKPVIQTDQWRCIASDPDGKVGAINLSGASGMQPEFPSGTCIVRAQPSDLVRAPRRLLGRRVEISSLGCYQHGPHDFRCLPFMAHRFSSPENSFMLMAREFTGDEAIAQMREACPTLRRALESRDCQFSVLFTLVGARTDQMETMRIVDTEKIEARPHKE